MLVSHESPLQLLEESKSYNDYDYCLVHLLSKYPEYLKFFKDSVKSGRRVLLDNSLFELKEAFRPDLFASWVDALRPFEYVVPDVYTDADATIANFESWLKNYGDLPGRKIGVVHGKSYMDYVKCYKYMTSHADKIAFSFDNPFLESIGYSDREGHTRWHILAEARQRLIGQLILDNIWDNTMPHHLLGCSLPQEFLPYGMLCNIESIDTSNPVVAGIMGIPYGPDGLHDKVTILLADLIEANLSDNEIELIYQNIEMFRKINNIIKD